MAAIVPIYTIHPVATVRAFAGAPVSRFHLITSARSRTKFSSIESLKSAHTSKFTSLCESMELASEVLYVLCKYADFFLCTAQTNVFLMRKPG